MQLKLEKQVWVKKSFAYDNGSLVTFYSVKNSMKNDKRDLNNGFGERTRIMRDMIFLDF